MKYFSVALLVLTFLLSSSTPCFATQTPHAKKIIEIMDRLYRSDSSFAQVEMTIVNPNWERTIKMNIWAKGMKKTFIRILSPKKDKGIATLRVKNEMWNYLPKVDKTMRIPPSMMMQPWMGSDFTNDDLVKESTFLDDYNFELLESPKGEEKYYFIKLIPKEKTASVWGKIIAKVRREDYIPIVEEYYDEHGKKMRQMLFSEVKVLGGKKIPSIITLESIVKKNHKTIIKYTKLNFDKGVDPTIFSLRNLRRRNF